jgi:hypothetical protein
MTKRQRRRWRRLEMTKAGTRAEIQPQPAQPQPDRPPSQKVQQKPPPIPNGQVEAPREERRTADS